MGPVYKFLKCSSLDPKEDCNILPVWRRLNATTKRYYRYVKPNSPVRFGVDGLGLNDGCDACDN